MQTHTHIIPNDGGGHRAKECAVDHNAPVHVHQADGFVWAAPDCTIDHEPNAEPAIEYALGIEWSDGEIEYVPARSFAHAEEMARKLYAHRPTWTVGREVQPWRYVRRTDAVLTDEVAR